jgi:hypothetical protein
VTKTEGKKPILRHRLRFQILLAYKKKYGVDERGSTLDRGIHFPLCHYIQTGSEADRFCSLMDVGIWCGILKTFDPNTRHVTPSPLGGKKESTLPEYESEGVFSKKMLT